MAVLYTPFENLQAIYFVDWKWSCKCIKKKKVGFFLILKPIIKFLYGIWRKTERKAVFFFFIIHRTVLIQAIRVLKFIRITWVTTALHPSLVVVSVETVLIAHQCLVAAEWWVCVWGWARLLDRKELPPCCCRVRFDWDACSLWPRHAWVKSYRLPMLISCDWVYIWCC